MVFKYKDKTPDADFIKFDNALVLIDKLRNGEVILNEIKDDQTKFKIRLGRNKKSTNIYIYIYIYIYILKESKNARENIENLYNARKAAIDFFDKHFSRASEARRQAKK